MFIRRAQIRNVRSIKSLEWESPKGQRASWNAVLGDNGAGKSSFLRALALCLVGPKEAAAARQDWNAWLRSGSDFGRVTVQLGRDAQYDSFSGKGNTGNRQSVSAGVRLIRLYDTTVELLKTNIKPISADRHIWGTGGGWFSVAYGPFRRFTGGDKEADRIFLSSPRLGAHVSVFGENIALTESLYWLRELNYKKLEKSPEGHVLNRLKHFVNQDGFLPHKIQLRQVSSKGVEFEDANGFSVAIEELSDGYRSILSMTFELIRQMLLVYPEDSVFDEKHERIVVPGVVMIDEIDAHLHPTWQKKIGFWLTRHFPNIQFIVTTHSPLICQAAVNGSIFRLPTPGSDEEGKMLEGAERDRLLYGDILEAYSTEAFGTTDTRSKQGNDMQEKLAALNVKELAKGLTKEEREEQERLRSMFPTSPHLVTKQLIDGSN
jgi:AAA domain, putative AbiEii toxin, Type IV TA system